jgi:P4 family phage/plasmid primase-like protien
MIHFTHFHAPNVAKRYEIVNGLAVKKPAATFKSGPFKTVSVTSMCGLAAFLEKQRPGDFITAGVNQTQPSGMCGLGEGDVHRTKEDFPFASGKPGLLIIDGDNLEELKLHDTNSFAKALELLIGDTDYSLSPSASSGITVNSIVGPVRGIHAFVFIHDASQIPESLEILHKRAVILGYGYPLITKAGVTLIRSLVDTAMKTSNQPCYEGGALLSKGITQDRKISYRQHCDEPRYLNVVPLSLEEDAEFEIKTKELTGSVSEEAAAVRAAWCEARGKTMVEKGCEPQKVKAILDSALSGERPVLQADFEIYTDRYGVKTVRELLADRAKYHGATCGDPLDPDDGVGKAKIYTLNQEGRPAINSFAHGGSVYILEEDLFRDLTDEDIRDLAQNGIPSKGLDSNNSEGYLTDVANGERFAREFHDQLLFIRDTQIILRYDNSMGWAQAPSTVPIQAAKIIVQAMRATAAEAFRQDLGNAKAMLAEATRTSKEPNLKAMINMAKTEDGMSVALEELDADPYLLGVLNGVVNLKTQTLILPSPDILVTKRTNMHFAPVAECPDFERFLNQILPNQLEHEFVIRWLGYLLSGLVTLQFFLFFLGSGSNGKSVLVELMCWLLGDYAQKIHTEMLMKQYRSSQSASPDLVSLAGRRLIYCNETTDGQKLDDARVKELTGGDTITGRVPYATQAVSFRPTHKLVMVGNHAPIIQDDSYGMWRRIKLIPFSQKFKEGDPGFDPYLLDKLKAESAGILNLLLAGFADFQKSGIQVPKSLEDATNVYRSEQDLLEQWITENCTVSPTVNAKKDDLYCDYEHWCRASGVMPISRPRFSRKLTTEKGYAMKTDKRTIIGIGITPWAQREEEITEPQAKAPEEVGGKCSGWDEDGEAIDVYLDRVLGVADGS